ncbi:MAG: hypothetical protein BMS9Abin28_1690 [Anaerolineae bacterium]|nr:MAG: hypothetical protein BMS9Abin28_1690 [Anaerolineae bacterium]
MQMSRDEPQDINSALDSCLLLIDEQGISLEDCLERFPQHREELQRLLPVALRIGRGRALSASEELRLNLAARLEGLRDLHRQSSPGFLVTNLIALRSIFRNRNPKPQRRAMMIPALVTFLVVAVLSMSGLVASADAAGPGDFLFGLDTAIEDVRLSFTRDEEKEAALRVEFATERLEELRIEVEGEGDRQLVEQALAEFDEALAEIEALLGELSQDQRAAFEQALAQLMASEQSLFDFEIELDIEDGRGDLKLEIELEGDGDLDSRDLDEGDLDDDDLDDHDLDEVDLADDDLDDDDDCAIDSSSDQDRREGDDGECEEGDQCDEGSSSSESGDDQDGSDDDCKVDDHGDDGNDDGDDGRQADNDDGDEDDEEVDD